MIYQHSSDKPTLPVFVVHSKQLNTWWTHLPEVHQRWLETLDFKQHEHHQVIPLPSADKIGTVTGYVFLLKDIPESAWLIGDLALQLPPGHYHLDLSFSAHEDQAVWCELAYLAWGLAQYRFDQYRSKDTARGKRHLILPTLPAAQVDQLKDWCETINWVRDLINAPCEAMGPDTLAAKAQELTDAFGGTCEVTLGDALLTNNYPAIHAVGRAGAREPRLIDCRWPAPQTNQPIRRLTLVGKGVCFDTGGLDLKPSAAMRWMKKDMGGAAHALGLARMIQKSQLPIELRVLIPAVENNIDANSYRPGDILSTRAGLFVEVSNTDAEGRLILADALTLASEEKPDCIIDFATLTGAARVALGPDLVGLFSNSNDMARAIVAEGETCSDPMWQLPLYQPYQPMLDSTVADLLNAPGGRFGGAITAALFLQRFVKTDIPWIHLDLYGSNEKQRPGRPAGGEAMGLRAMYRWLVHSFLRS